MDDIRFIVCDVESTGLGGSAQAVEIAWAEVDEDLNIKDMIHTLLDPEMPIEYGASGIHGIANEDVIDCPTWDEFFTEVRPGKIPGNVILIAHNAQFDKRFFERACEEKLVATLCTLRLARRFLPEMENHKLATLMYALHLPRQTSHRADGDVITCINLLKVLKEESGLSLLELAELSVQPLSIKTWPIGKHRGTPIAEVVKNDRSYLRWALSNIKDMDPDLRASVEAAM